MPEGWPEKLAGARIVSIDTHGKHLFLRFDNGLTIHSHLPTSRLARRFDDSPVYDASVHIRFAQAAA